jgi:phage terminase large subunit
MIELPKIKASPVYLANWYYFHQPQYKIFVNQGGTRSGKTFSITQNLINLALEKMRTISVVSVTHSHLKRGVIRDFKVIMNDWNIFNENSFNKTDLIYQFPNGSIIEFFSADNSAKLRGSGRDILFINEANLLSYDEWKQLTLRTREKIFIDYNPVDEFSWIYEKVLPREDCCFIQSCYLDNKQFLPAEQIEEIERLREEDENYWQVFGLGNVAHSTDLIYNKISVTNQLPFGEIIYGIDFGFNNPTTLLQISRDGNEIFINELLYERRLTNSDLIEQLEILIPNKFDCIYADSAEPQRIEEIHQSGFNIYSSDKSVKAGIDYCQRFKINIYKESINTIKELRTYKWKQDKNGNKVDEPVKFNDHACDTMRYAVFTHGQKYWSDIGMVFPNIHLNKINKKTNYDNY